MFLKKYRMTTKDKNIFLILDNRKEGERKQDRCLYNTDFMKQRWGKPLLFLLKEGQCRKNSKYVPASREARTGNWDE